MSTSDDKSTRITATFIESVEPAIDPSELDVVETIEAVRNRPGMYVGGINDYGLHHLFTEILNNALAEVLDGQCTEVSVVHKPDSSLSVADNGRGIPVEIHAPSGKAIAELIFTGLWPARYFGMKTRDWRGIGAAVVNALSSWLECEVRRDGKVYRQRFTHGVPDAPLAVVSTCGEGETGTTVTWLADPTVFTQALNENSALQYNLERLRSRLRELAYLNPGVTFTFHNAHDEQETETYHYPRGIAEYVALLNTDKAPIHPEAITVHGERDSVQVDIAFQYNQIGEEAVYSYVNTFETSLGGTHVVGFERGLTRSINQYARQNNLLNEGDANFSRIIVQEGVTAVVSIYLPNPMFPGATRERLGNAEVTSIVSRITGKQLSAYFSQHPEVAQAIIEKIAAAKIRATVQKQRSLPISKEGAIVRNTLCL